MWEYHAAIVGGCRMKELLMDGRDWPEPDDVCNSFFHAVGAPSWHGRNFNALRDSVAARKINRIEVPYCLVIQNYGLISEGAREMTDDFIELIRELRARGCEVEVRTDDSKTESGPPV